PLDRREIRSRASKCQSTGRDSSPCTVALEISIPPLDSAWQSGGRGLTIGTACILTRAAFGSRPTPWLPAHQSKEHSPVISILRQGVVAAALAAGLALIPAQYAAAQDKVVAIVNGKSITEAGVRLAEAEIGSDLGSLPEATKRRVRVEYLIEHQLFAEAAEGEQLGYSPELGGRMQYWRRRALSDTYVDKSVKEVVTEADAKRLYDQQVKLLKPEEEVKA